MGSVCVWLRKVTRPRVMGLHRFGYLRILLLSSRESASDGGEVGGVAGHLLDGQRPRPWLAALLRVGEQAEVDLRQPADLVLLDGADEAVRTDLHDDAADQHRIERADDLCVVPQAGGRCAEGRGAGDFYIKIG